MEEEIPDGYVRVTDVLKCFRDFSNIDPAVLNNAADRGEKVHKYCELYVQNLLIEEPVPECKKYVDSFIQWFDENVEAVEGLEERLNHEVHKISGKYDMIVRLKNDPKLYLLDIKTPQQPSASWALQTAAYEMLLRDCKDIYIDGRFCLILNKNGKKAKQVIYENKTRDMSLYLSALELYRYFNPEKKKELTE